VTRQASDTALLPSTAYQFENGGTEGAVTSSNTPRHSSRKGRRLSRRFGANHRLLSPSKPVDSPMTNRSSARSTDIVPPRTPG
jgi:hypothetical protein